MRFSRRYLSEQPRKALRAAGFSDYGIYHVLRKGKPLSPYMKEKAVKAYAVVKLHDKGLNYKESEYQYERSKGDYVKLENVKNKMVRYARELAEINNPGKRITKEFVNNVLSCMALKSWILPDIMQYMKLRRSADYNTWNNFKEMRKKYGPNCTYQAYQQIEATKKLFPDGGGVFPVWYKHK